MCGVILAPMLEGLLVAGGSTLYPYPPPFFDNPRFYILILLFICWVLF